MSSNEHEIWLLRNDPAALVVEYLPVVRRMAERYTEAGSFSRAEVDDVVQNISEKLLRAAPSIAASYQRRSLLSTYMYTVVQNFLNQEYSALQRAPARAEFHDTMRPSRPVVEAAVDLKWHFSRFRSIVELYGGRRAKVSLGLKIFCGLPVTGDDVLEAYPHCPGTHLLTFLRTFGDGTGKMGETEAFLAAGSLIRQIERKEGAADSFRRWVNLRIDEIIELLNGKPPVFHFDRKILRSLIIFFFQNEGRD